MRSAFNCSYVVYKTVCLFSIAVIILTRKINYINIIFFVKFYNIIKDWVLFCIYMFYK